MQRQDKKAQVIIEYAILTVAVIAAVIGFNVYVKRAIVGNHKATADQIGEQFTTNPGAPYDIVTIQNSQSAETYEQGRTESTLNYQTTTRDIKNFNSGKLGDLNVFNDQ